MAVTTETPNLGSVARRVVKPLGAPATTIANMREAVPPVVLLPGLGTVTVIMIGTVEIASVIGTVTGMVTETRTVAATTRATVVRVPLEPPAPALLRPGSSSSSSSLLVLAGILGIRHGAGTVRLELPELLLAWVLLLPLLLWERRPVWAPLRRPLPVQLPRPWRP